MLKLNNFQKNTFFCSVLSFSYVVFSILSILKMAYDDDSDVVIFLFPMFYLFITFNSNYIHVLVPTALFEAFSITSTAINIKVGSNFLERDLFFLFMLKHYYSD